MSDVLKTLTNLRSLRALARELSLEELKTILEKLTLVVKEKHQEAEEQQQANRERLERIEKYKSLLKEEGISLEELSGDAVQAKPAREKRPPKYKFVENGETKTWNGQGRMPKALQAQLKAGKSLEDFSI